MANSAIPEGYHTVTPFLLVEDLPKQLEFLKQAFGAEEKSITKLPDGAIANAEITIGDSVLMISPARGEILPTVASFYLYVADTDAVYQQALAAGGSSILEPADMFYGDRNAGVKDDAGNTWWIATRLENLSAEEVDQRAATEHRLS